MRHRLWSVVLLSGLGVGCMAAGNATSGSALVHPEFPYAVTYDDEQERSLLGEDWALESYRKVTAPDKSISLERKQGNETTYEFDFDDDDKEDASATLPNPDLVLVNKKTNARIEVSTLLLDRRLANKELRVLLSNIVESGAGTRALFVGFGRLAVGLEKRFASRLLDSGPATLDGNAGLVATVEHADLDQLQLNPAARWRRSRLFLVHAPFDYFATATSHQAQAKTTYHKYRVLLLVEYSNTPEDFEAQYPELLRLLNKIHLLNDDELLSYLAEPLAKCGKGTTASLTLKISEIGEATTDAVEGLDPLCAAPIVTTYRFAAKGEPRTVEHKYDFSKSRKPAWLSKNAYVEERTPPAEPQANQKPAEPPALAAPEAPSDPTSVAPDGSSPAGPVPAVDAPPAPVEKAPPAEIVPSSKP
jgi:hypothetical protein